ncbi:alternative ribosome rescue aminoacyl-tRNA hydrolase ArfB [Phenylobacterium montanum]|uniref:Aminoacyl-tRNA hydrolase n=1 Tax=Phenylobacterium montanum TaxID=2823693 RepID=A0A975IUW1_9CAUL|nr:alternative ribosome rescue aminoacyl-tRNA hydrolase ArfB [Caulobacter sp. S6]QUD87929.1 aminoacyl-tRNA hydrolase [Caulobacter sp. S6]
MPTPLEITPSLSIDEDEIAWRAVRASGPGGQHVNKTSTAVELRFDVAASPSLPEDVKQRLIALAGSRATQEGVLVLFAQNSRSQEMNRQDALARLVDLIRQAAHRPKARRPTRPTYASKLKRLEGKTRRAGVKSMRGRPRGED